MQMAKTDGVPPAGKKRITTKAPIQGFDPELLDAILGDYQAPEDLIGEGGVLKRLTAALVNRAMDAEMKTHLGYSKGEAPNPEQINRRNGKTTKTVRSGHGDLFVETPRDREGTFEPQLIPKHQRQFNGFDDRILSMYARGMSTREIQAHLEEIYGVNVSPDLISDVTDSIVDELRTWQQRPLDPVYVVVYIDALVVKTRAKGHVENRAVYVVVGVTTEGRKEVLGLWMQATEGAKYWLTILEELKRRGLKDIFILCADGLTGLPQAVETAFPKTIFQTCIVHMVRSSMRFVPWKDRKAVCASLRKIYTAVDEAAALAALEDFEAKWGGQYPTIAKAWSERWDELTPFLEFPDEIRRVVYTTNAVEALNRQLRKVLKTKGHLPSDEAALKLLYLACLNAEKSWTGKSRNWTMALAQFAVCFEGRMPTPA